MHPRKDLLESKHTLVILLLLVFGGWVAWAFIAPCLATRSYTNAGTFGDMFGGLNTLFTGFAFAGLVYTIVLQRKALRQAENELADAKASNRQQHFENVFFQLLSLLNAIVDALTTNDKRGRDALFPLANNLICGLRLDPKADGEAEWKRIREYYSEFYDRFETSLAHYFRLVYRILRLIENSDMADKSFYVKTLRAQLSSQELVLLFHNGFSEKGAKMKPLLEKYALLKHLPESATAYPDHRNFYEASAYVDKKS